MHIVNFVALINYVYLCFLVAGGELIPASGTIIESYDNTIIVLTSANLLRRHTFGKLGENVLADDLKVNFENQNNDVTK